eukprot:340609-Rhodomonas_salina.1
MQERQTPPPFLLPLGRLLSFLSKAPLSVPSFWAYYSFLLPPLSQQSSRASSLSFTLHSQLPLSPRARAHIRKCSDATW